MNKKERKLWILPDKNINFRNMHHIINHLESLPIKKHTLKKISEDKINDKNNDKNKIKLTKKNITF